MRGVRAQVVVLALVGLVVMPAAAAAKSKRECEIVVRTYVATYEGTWHNEGYFPAGDGTGSYTDDATWSLRSKDKPFKMTTSDCRGGGVEGGVVTGEMEGSAVRTQTYTETGFPTSSSQTDGPDVIDASLDSDEGKGKTQELGASGLDYQSYGNKDTEVYPMDIDARRPRKGYALKISGSQTTTGPGEFDTASIDATWTLELARKKRLD
jgi:hypothetical protein